MTREAAVKASQRLLSGKTKLKDDGRWGPRTEQAYVSASDSVKGAVRTVVTNMGFQIDDLRGPYNTDKMLSAKAMAEIIGRASAQSGVSAAVLQQFLDLEASSVELNGERLYNPSAINALGYRGLFQFDRFGHAWKSASSVGSLPTFETGWTDPYANTLAAAYYIVYNTKVIRRLGYSGPITPNVAYLMHNQGAAGAASILAGTRGPVGKQSPAALAVIRQAVSETRTA